MCVRHIARLRVVDWIGGKATTLANLQISKSNDGCIYVKTINQKENYFPNYSILTKMDDKYYYTIILD